MSETREVLVERAARAMRDAFYPVLADDPVGPKWSEYAAAVVDALGVEQVGSQIDDVLLTTAEIESALPFATSPGTVIAPVFRIRAAEERSGTITPFSGPEVGADRGPKGEPA